MSDGERIEQLVARSPGLRAQQIADELGIERSQVVTTLHGLLGRAVVQAESYR
jgi:predicted ArsR family transcriptional regulator